MRVEEFGAASARELFSDLYGAADGYVRILERHEGQLLPSTDRTFDGGSIMVGPFLIRADSLSGRVDVKVTLNIFSSMRTHRQADLKWVTCAHVDLDCRDVDEGTLLETLKAMQESRDIPPLSVIVLTGRGAWCLWLLRSEGDPLLPIACDEAAQARVRDLNRRLARRFAVFAPELRPDATAGDLARTIRLPGSLHSKGGVVRWARQLTSIGETLTYSLNDLEASICSAGAGTDIRRRRRTVGKRRHPKFDAERRLAFLEALNAARGGMSDRRKRVLFLYAATLAALENCSDASKRARLGRFNDQLNPPLPDRMVESRWRSAQKSATGGPYRFTDDYIFRELEVSPTESLLLRTYRPDRNSETRQNRKAAGELRRFEIASIIERDGGLNFSTRRLAAALARKGMPAGSPKTLARDIRNLGFQYDRKSGKWSPV